MAEIKKIIIDGGTLRKDARYRICGNPEPVISWAVLSDVKNSFQKSFNIKVWNDDSVLWDCGEIVCDKQEAVYGGKPLVSGVKTYVSVSVKDNFDNVSDEMTDYFYYGNIEWDAEWISAKEDNERDRAVIYFKKNISAGKKIKSAYIYACGLGYHKVFVNGNLIDESIMDPAHSDYGKTCYYAIMPEIQEYFNSGDNCIGVMLADGWRRNEAEIFKWAMGERKVTFFGIPQLSLILDIVYDDGTKERITTDDTWEYSYGEITSSNLFDGEEYNALESAHDYTAAAIVEAPGGVMIPNMLEPIRESKVYDAISIAAIDNDRYIVDFGQNIAGVARLKLPENMTAGQKITLKFAEVLDEDGSLYTEPLRKAKVTDTYTASGDCGDLKEWQPLFTYHGFRYAQVEGYGKILKKSDIKAVSFNTDLEKDSWFICGDPMVNKIHENIVMTERANMHSILTDCPQRDERMGWMNDATVRFDETPYNFDIGRMFPKIVRDLQDSQIDGGITCTAPYSFGARPADPVCSSYLVAGYQALMHTGNKNVIKNAYDGYAAWENVLLERSDDYIVNYSYYGDWASPAYACVGDDGANSAVTPGIYISTGFSYFNCKLLSYFAGVLGYEAEVVKYNGLADKIKQAILTKWYDSETAVMATGSQACQSFALWLGLIDDQRAADKIHEDLVANEYKITTGNLCTRYMFEVLSIYGYTDDVWKLLTRQEYPSYGFMIQNEATTIWERFELKKNPGMNSHSHPMYGSVGYWFYACLGGIKIKQPACEEIDIRPYMPSDLLSANVNYDSVKGDINVKWVKKYGKTYLYVNIPFGVKANVYFDGKVQTVGSGYHVFEA